MARDAWRKTERTLRGLEELQGHLDQERASTPPEKRVVFGACSWIPDKRSSFGDVEGTRVQDKQHPWVVTEPSRREPFPKLYACPRTSKVQPESPTVFVMDADLLPTLEKPGYVLLNRRWNCPCTRFCDYEHIGILPDDWQSRLRAALAVFRKTQATQISRMSGE